MNDTRIRETHIRIEHVSKHWGDFTALKDVSLEVKKGEFICFLGPSGCGKTTLLRAVAGLDMQSEGRIVMNGRDVSDLPPARRDFGIVFQSYALFPNLTVADNVAYGLHGKRLPRSQVNQRVQELLALVGLPDQGKKHPAQLSLAGSSSAWRWPVRWPLRLVSSCWTSRSRRWMRACAPTCAMRSSSCKKTWA